MPGGENEGGFPATPAAAAVVICCLIPDTMIPKSLKTQGYNVYMQYLIYFSIQDKMHLM